MSLDLEKLECVESYSKGAFLARCPACADEGHDSEGNHLIIYPDGQFACAKWQAEAGIDHRRKIYAMAGVRGSRKIQRRRIQDVGTGRFVSGPNPRSSETWDLAPVKMAMYAKKARDYASMLPLVLEEYAWSIEAANAESWPVPAKPIEQFRHWLALFAADDVLCIGHRECTGRDHFRTALEWSQEIAPPFKEDKLAEGGIKYFDHGHFRPWLPGSERKSKENRLPLRYRNLECDGADLATQMAVINFARKGLGLTIPMIVNSGGKSLHALVDVRSMVGREFQIELILCGWLRSGGLGGDGSSWHSGTTRIPGVRRNADAKNDRMNMQRICWLDPTWPSWSH